MLWRAIKRLNDLLLRPRVAIVMAVGGSICAGTELSNGNAVVALVAAGVSAWMLDESFRAVRDANGS